MKNNYTLIVVDMQKEFSASRNVRVQKNCKKLLTDAMQHGATIVFLEYVGAGRTLNDLYCVVDNYDRVHFVRKSDDDGSKEIMQVVKGLKLPKGRFKVCGVNTDYCVHDTVVGLAKRSKATIEVIQNACNSEEGMQSHQRALKAMARSRKVKHAKV